MLRNYTCYVIINFLHIYYYFSRVKYIKYIFTLCLYDNLRYFGGVCSRTINLGFAGLP